VLGALIATSSTLAAEQISPNPNDGTIEIPTDGNANSVWFFHNRSAGTIRANAGGAFTNTRTLRNDGRIEFANVSSLINEGRVASLQNRGTVAIRHAELMNQNGAYISNEKEIVSTGLAAHIINVGSGITNYRGGTITNAQRGRLLNQQKAGLVNSGRLVNEGATLINETQAELFTWGTWGGQLINTRGGLVWNRLGARLTNLEAGMLANEVGSRVINESTALLRNASGATLNNGGMTTEFENRATVINTGSGTNLSNVFGATLRNEGPSASLTNEGGATLRNRTSGSTLINSSDASMINTGRGTALINGDRALLINDGTVASGSDVIFF
jgi:hypothetical protein